MASKYQAPRGTLDVLPEQLGGAPALATELRHAGVSAEADGSAQVRDTGTGEQRLAEPGNLVEEMKGGGE